MLRRIAPYGSGSCRNFVEGFRIITESFEKVHPTTNFEEHHYWRSMQEGRSGYAGRIVETTLTDIWLRKHQKGGCFSYVTLEWAAMFKRGFLTGFRYLKQDGRSVALFVRQSVCLLRSNEVRINWQMFVKRGLSILPQDRAIIIPFNLHSSISACWPCKIIMCDPRTTAGALLHVPKNVES
jgi:hypothetical protein